VGKSHLIAQLGRVVEQEAKDKNIPAIAVVVVDRQGPTAEVVYGATPETLFRTGSVGKTLTDLAVLIAAAQGRVDLDVDVRKYLPEFHPENPFEEPITLRHLIMHVAGLVREPPVGNYFDATSPTLAETVASLNRTRLLWKPGSRTKYSNAGLAVVGRVLEAVYGRSYAEVMKERVFGPAHMHTATVGGAGAATSRTVVGLMQRPDGTTWPAPRFDLGMAPAGDLYASVRDMGSFLAALLARESPLARPATLGSMWTPYPPRDDWQLEIGLGFSLNGRFDGRYRLARNGGAVYGFATELALLPEEGLGVFAAGSKDLANGTIQHIAHWALLAALAERRGTTPPAFEPTPVPFGEVSAAIARCSVTPDDLPHARLLGVYGEDHNPLIVCRKDGKLYAVIEWMFLYPLEERADGSFEFPSYALYGHEMLRFEGDGEHPATAVVGFGADGVRFRRRADPTSIAPPPRAR